MSTIGRPAYGFIGHILFGTIVAGGMTAAVGMVCALRSEQGLLSSAFPEFLLVFVLAAEGAYAWVHFHQAKAEDRVRLLDSLYAEFDTARARRAREAIYNTPRENLRIAYLHLPEHKKERDLVDSTIASLERLSYRVLKLDVESEDAFQLWGGVMLQVCHKVWPYILEQREQRPLVLVRTSSFIAGIWRRSCASGFPGTAKKLEGSRHQITSAQWRCWITSS